MIKVAIIGASGYTGLELMRLSTQHTHIELIAVSSEKFAEKKVGEVLPSLSSKIKLAFHSITEGKDVKEADFVFVALPHREAMSVVPQLIKQGKKVVDLSADFRFRNPAIYEKWYQKHTAPELLKDAVYGLSELYREKIKNAQLVANPGCYPTAVLLSLAPVIKNKVIDLNTIIVDAKSGVSGAGRSVVLSSLYTEVNEGVKAYKVAQHQHTPEMEQELSLIAQKDITLSFTPHLIPMNRGILSTIYTTLSVKISEEEVYDLYKAFYQKDTFVRMCPLGTFPSTHQVKGSNYCDMGVTIDSRTNRLIIISAIDNLLKGGSGQAMQNMNIMTGLSEDLGINQPSLFP
ncbi:MAG: N-acetyl-gamma-glutamyl-phosphate reductase [Deltaproteobacteria bacterium DG_8]|nr:MAG: N-acetyl-gamma-glutamyl-phosphate reductase [Deltaproteobacteria bacterium DG_8]